MLCVALMIRVVVGAVLPITDPTEGRYAQIASEMVASGDWVTPRVWFRGDQVPYLGKPPLFFWTAALSIMVFGSTEIAVRLPAIAAVLLLFILMFQVIKRSDGAGAAGAAVIIAATTGLVFFLSATAIVDLHLMLFVSGALFAHLACVQAGDRSRSRKLSVLTFALIAGGVLTKGPVAIVLVCLPVGVWTTLYGTWNTLRAHSWRTGLLVFTILVGPWFILAELRNPGFIEYFFVNENFLRFLSTSYGDRYGTGHVFPRGSSLLMFSIGALPWTPVAIWLAIRRRWRLLRWTLRDERASFLLIAFLTIVVFWGFARQLLPTYLLPAIPLFSAWLAVAMNRVEAPSRVFRSVAMGAAALWCLLAVAVAPIVVTKSTREILAETSSLLQRRIEPAKVVFAGRTPQSAAFYAPDLVTHHADEPVAHSLSRIAGRPNDTLLIISDRDWQGLTDGNVGMVRSLTRVPGWRILASATADRRASILGKASLDRRPLIRRRRPSTEPAPARYSGSHRESVRR
jgi:4-amino-4-deoxy-L-arabinose transferase-like glycosyltransferase